MTGAGLIALAAKRNVNPYYLAYALATGAECCKQAFERDGGNHFYMGWNNALWDEQAKAERVSREFVSILDGAFERHCDLLAAQVEEAKAA